MAPPPEGGPPEGGPPEGGPPEGGPPGERGASGDGACQRLDTWLWSARFMKTRAECTRFAEAGLLRINRQPTDKAHARLRVGDILTVPLRRRVMVLEVLALAARRGPAREARRLYREITESSNAALRPHACGSAETTAYPDHPTLSPTRSPR